MMKEKPKKHDKKRRSRRLNPRIGEIGTICGFLLSFVIHRFSFIVFF